MSHSTKNVAIIGAGIVGASAAFYLSQQFKDQLDIYDEGEGQATSAAAGIICPWLSRRRNKKWYRLVKEGAAMYPDFLKEAGVDIENSAIYKNTGTIIFKKKEEHLEEMAALAKERRKEAPAIGELEIMNADKIRNLLPIYEGEKPGLFVSGGSRVDGQLLVQHLLKKASEQGAKFMQARAELREGTEKRYRIETKKGAKEYDIVILATGAWLPILLEPLGYKVDIRPQKGQLAELILPYADTGNWPVVMPQGEKDIIFFPEGRTVIGATHEDDEGYDLSVQTQLLQPMVQEAIENFSSHLKKSTKVNYRVGTRAYTSDYGSFMGKVPGKEALYTASGLGSTGLTAGPLVGKILSQLATNQVPDLPLEDYPVDQYIKKSAPSEPIL